MSILTYPAEAARLAAGGADRPRGAVVDSFVLSIAPRPGEGVSSVVGRFAEALRERQAKVLKLLVFAPSDVKREFDDELRRQFRTLDWPVTWVQGGRCNGARIAGLQAFAATGPKSADLPAGRIVGSVYEDGAARYCLLGGIGPSKTALPRFVQAWQVFDNLGAALAEAGFGLMDVVRTWFYNEDLLDWYQDFNRVRTALYERPRSARAPFRRAPGSPRTTRMAPPSWPERWRSSPFIHWPEPSRSGPPCNVRLPPTEAPSAGLPRSSACRGAA